jgi:hypothetical protein
MMRRILKCVQTHDLRSNADAVARNAEDERSLVSPRLTEPALAVFCDRPWITGTFECMPCVRTQAFFQLPINRPLGHLV